MKMGKWAMHDDGEEKVMEELSKGRELAMQLRRLLLNIDHDQPIIGAGAGEDDVDDPVEHLAGKILDSFRNSLSILNNYSDHHHQVSHSIINSYSGISDHDQRTTTVPKATAAAWRKQAGGYKRRKCSELDIRKTEHSTIEYDDGHPWRKYGQKIIHNAKFPRSYYRCTHKYDQGCGARKQMEMIQQNPAKYVSRYYGHHTCTSPQKHVQFLLESSDQYYTTNYSNSTNGMKKNNNNVKMLSFGSDHDPCSCSPSTTTTSTFQLPARTAAPPCTVFSPSTSTSTTLQVEDDHDLMKISDKLHCNSSSSNIVKDDDDDDDEQGAAVLLTQQLHPAPADHNWWCLSPEYLLPIGSSDDDDASNDSVDFTDLQHYFTFS